MTYKTFEELPVWQEAKILTINVYRYLRSTRDWGFRDQIQRASVSVMNNIAEGFERGSTKELRHFLYVAKGSCGEVRSMLSLTQELNIIPEEESNTLFKRSESISRMLSGFIRSLSHA